MKNHKAFSVVELLITLVIATIFITAAYQLYSTVLTDSGDSRKESAASNTAYDYLRRYSAGLTGSCTPSSQIFSNVAITEVGNATITVTISCPYSITQTTPGTYSWTVPNGVTSATIDAWGAGGGGGGANYAVRGGSGGGGGEFRSSTVTVTPGSTYSYTVGTGGVGGTASPQTNGGNGTSTTFNTTTVVANGGGGAITSTGVAGTGGTGGTGTTGYSGAVGATISSGNNGGGGGSSAGNLANGVAGSTSTGGTAPTGGGNGGGGGITQGTTVIAGSSGSTPGGGGGGGSSYGNPPGGANGGKGADGKITITYSALNSKDIFKITVSVTYNNPTNTVTYSSYVQV